WRGQISFETPMMFAIGFLVTFLFGGLSGVLLAAPPIDFHVSDSYFVIAHFHYVLFGTIVFAVFAGIYFWFPKMFGRMLDDPWGHGNSLEWATSCPPPLRNFDKMPRIRSERPAFDLKFPELAAGEQSLAGPPEGGAKPLTSQSDGGATYQDDIASDRDR